MRMLLPGAECYDVFSHNETDARNAFGHLRWQPSTLKQLSNLPAPMLLAWDVVNLIQEPIVACLAELPAAQEMVVSSSAPLNPGVLYQCCSVARIPRKGLMPVAALCAKCTKHRYSPISL